MKGTPGLGSEDEGELGRSTAVTSAKGARRHPGGTAYKRRGLGSTRMVDFDGGDDILAAKSHGPILVGLER